MEPLPNEETKGFGNCIPEHERLMLKTQNIKNSIDIEQEENLPQYHTTFIIKTLYEKPKNLPGEDPEHPYVRFLSTNPSNEEESSEEEEDIDQEDLEDNKTSNKKIENTLKKISAQFFLKKYENIVTKKVK